MREIIIIHIRIIVRGFHRNATHISVARRRHRRRTCGTVVYGYVHAPTVVCCVEIGTCRESGDTASFWRFHEFIRWIRVKARRATINGNVFCTRIRDRSTAGRRYTLIYGNGGFVANVFAKWFIGRRERLTFISKRMILTDGI